MKAWRSLRVRLIFSYVTLALLLLAFAGYVFSNALSVYAVSMQNKQEAAYFRQAVGVLAYARLQNLSAKDTLALLQKEIPDVQVELLMAKAFSLPEGITLPSGTTAMPNLSGSFQEQMILTPGTMSLFFTAKPGERSFTLPSVDVTGGVPTVTAYRFTLSPSDLLFKLYRQVVEVLVLALVLAGLIGWLLSRWLARPLSGLAAATEAVAEGNFLETVEQSGIVELDRVVEQFNRMILHLRDSFRSLAAERDTAQRFAGDAAHELKTPVATLRVYHDVISEHPERLDQASPAIVRQIDRMERVIAGLLQMAYLGKEESDYILEPIDIAAALRTLAPVYEALADESGQHLTLTQPPGPVPCNANQRLLELALNNLMDNACKYTQPGGRVALALAVAGRDALITVADSGPGIPAEELPYIFDRFHRGVATQSVPGTGLGLAIAREAVQRMGGQITAQSEAGRGSRFVIRLPLGPST